jgi:hypothetical protein
MQVLHRKQLIALDTVFHGNGEIISNYDHISALFIKNGLNLVVADYLGYGSSNGTPSLTDLYKDAHIIFRTVQK